MKSTESPEQSFIDLVQLCIKNKKPDEHNAQVAQQPIQFQPNDAQFVEPVEIDEDIIHVSPKTNQFERPKYFFKKTDIFD